MTGEVPAIAVNARVLSSSLTGVQRYLSSILNYMPDGVVELHPTDPKHGVRGHAWEQLLLPARLERKLLWSPSNTGPLSVTKQVLTVHDLASFDHPEFLNSRFAAWYRFLLPRLVRRVRRIIAVSEFTKERLMELFGIPEERIAVIWNGVDDRFRPQAEGQVSLALNKLGIPTRRYFVALGSLEPRKNLQRLLQAWSRIVLDLPDDVWLVLAGAKGKSLIFDATSFDPLPPRVHLTGYVPDEMLPALYTGAIATPYLSVYEGFGLPPLEAMACGTQALTSNRTALPEVVGDAALAVDPYDVDAISDGLIRLVGDTDFRAVLRRRGFERAKRFSWRSTAEQTWRVLGEAAE